MKLYFAPGACSLSPHIVARELDIPLQIEKVDLQAKKTASGRDFLQINPKGYVPALELDDGDVLTEGPAIVQFLADQKPQAGLAPPNGTVAMSSVRASLNSSPARCGVVPTPGLATMKSRVVMHRPSVAKHTENAAFPGFFAPRQKALGWTTHVVVCDPRFASHSDGPA